MHERSSTAEATTPSATTAATAPHVPAPRAPASPQRPAGPDRGSPDRRCVAAVVRTAAQARAICATG